MAETLDLEIRHLAFGRPAKDAAYISITTKKGDTYRFHFDNRRQVSLIRSEASESEDQWPD